MVRERTDLEKTRGLLTPHAFSVCVYAHTHMHTENTINTMLKKIKAEL